MEPALIVENVSKRFRFKKSSPSTNETSNSNQFLTALENVSFSVNRGEMFGIIGLNGSGKTTLLRTIAQEKYPSTESLPHYYNWEQGSIQN